MRKKQVRGRQHCTFRHHGHGRADFRCPGTQLRNGDGRREVGCIFTFTNNGDADLVISSASASCGCTVPKFDKKPVPPGRSGTIEVIFDTSGREGVQTKTVVVQSNAENNLVILRIIADVTKRSR